jgi:hypothetical protein
MEIKVSKMLLGETNFALKLKGFKCILWNHRVQYDSITESQGPTPTKNLEKIDREARNKKTTIQRGRKRESKSS